MTGEHDNQTVINEKP